MQYWTVNRFAHILEFFENITPMVLGTIVPELQVANKLLRKVYIQYLTFIQYNINVNWCLDFASNYKIECFGILMAMVIWFLIALFKIWV